MSEEKIVGPSLKDARVVTVLRSALADLVGVMPEFEPSGDRKHSGWTTIAELREVIAEMEGSRSVFKEYPGEYPREDDLYHSLASERDNLRDWVEMLAGQKALEAGQPVVVAVVDFDDNYDLEIESGHATIAGTWSCNTQDEDTAHALGNHLEEVLIELGYQVLQEWPEEAGNDD